MPDSPSGAPTEPLAVPAPSYRALFAVPRLGRALLGTQIARIAGSMLGLTIVLFSLAEFHSPGLAGIITFTSIFPGLLASPIAGALLDRHGRTRLIVVDFAVATVAMGLIGALSLAGLLSLPLLLLIAGLAALTGPLSNVGLRTLFPLMVPKHLWERLNAIDANGWVVASIIGPPIAAVTVGIVGGAWALIVIAALYALAALVVARVPEPEGVPTGEATGSLVKDAWHGLRYAWSNRTIRGLGFSLSMLNIGGGMISIAIPLLILQRLGLPEAVVGLVFAVQGLTGVLVGLVAGRLDTRGRERSLIVWPMIAYAPAGLLLLAGGLTPIVLAMVVTGLLSGPMDVAMFTLRQRRTDPAWMGRAFAVSMSFNFSGYPIGAAIGGTLAAWSLDAAIWASIGTSVVAACLAALLIPARGRDFYLEPGPAEPAASGA